MPDLKSVELVYLVLGFIVPGMINHARPERLTADSAYGSAEMLGWLVNERAIEPHTPVFDKSARADGTFSREAFAYSQEADVYICPAGEELTSTGTGE